ncbi:hypothetical protein [Microseira wollei]|uniref:Uncharacterized protein n=1 Tax=Microseira wollei NIES-4236 TaxID=2530354 RepID=A0AAV3XPE0_9CYAN|nr:hypothetical protein [Microseira wollei]GET43581.1 hypothetical protein MiSe_84060 [Microseira wollei NIES-4236]
MSYTTGERVTSLYLDKKIAKFGDSVYQFRNITGFKVSEVKKIKISNVLPNKYLLVIYAVGFVLVNIANIGAAKILGMGLLLLAVSGLIANSLDLQTEPKEYKLEMSFNSGEKKEFIINDTDFKEDVVLALYKFMESSNEEAYFTINFHNQSIDQSLKYEDRSTSVIAPGGHLVSDSTVVGNLSSVAKDISVTIPKR